jgi:hypothetical protein
MKMVGLVPTLGGMVRAARQSLGLGLVVMACAGTALAGGGPPPDAPEIDAGGLVSALSLLTGGVLLLTDRFRRRS